LLERPAALNSRAKLVETGVNVNEDGVTSSENSLIALVPVSE
jgi:hypothetical protein